MEESRNDTPHVDPINVSKPVPDRIVAIPKENIITKNEETETMEVHHHSHAGHGKKTWKAYFWEFLMLFLAVFCGFLAEYELEHVIEHQREKQYIRSLVADLESDQQIVGAHILVVKQGLSMMDSMIEILTHSSGLESKTGDLYYLARLAPRLQPLSTNSRTFEQLKNSGNFRLIQDLETSNQIMNYYEKFPLIHLLENISETEFTEYKKAAANVFDPAIFTKMEGDGNAITRTSENPPLVSADKHLLQELSIFSVYMRGTKKGIIAQAEQIKTNGAHLLKYLHQQYHLE